MAQLAVCIPTYNRIIYLKDLLPPLLKQVSAYEKGLIQVCLSDNASTDGTEDYVLQLQKEFPDVELRYKKNETNLGAIRNFLKCVDLAQAEYCWLMGSDDGVPDKAVQNVLQAINRHAESDVLIGRRIACDAHLKPMFHAGWFSAQEDLTVNFKNSQQVGALFDQIRTTTAMCGLISVIVFKKEAWDSVTDYEAYLDTAYIQTYKLLRALTIRGTDMTYFTAEIALARHGNDSFQENLAQRIMLDIDGFLRISEVFQDPTLKNRFLGIVRRHFNNTFLYALALSSYPASQNIIEKIGDTGYSVSQQKIFFQPKAGLYLGLFCSFFGFLFSDPARFFQTIRITLQKL